MAQKWHKDNDRMYYLVINLGYINSNVDIFVHFCAIFGF